MAHCQRSAESRLGHPILTFCCPEIRHRCISFELIAVVKREWSALQNVFEMEKGKLVLILEEINESGRPDAHAKYLSDDEFAQLRLYLKKLETILDAWESVGRQPTPRSRRHGSKGLAPRAHVASRRTSDRGHGLEPGLLGPITRELLNLPDLGQAHRPARTRGLVGEPPLAGGGSVHRRGQAAGYFAAFFPALGPIGCHPFGHRLLLFGRHRTALPSSGVASDAVSATGVAAAVGRREEERRAGGLLRGGGPEHLVDVVQRLDPTRAELARFDRHPSFRSHILYRT